MNFGKRFKAIRHMNDMDKTIIKNTCIRARQSPSPDSDCCNFIYNKLKYIHYALRSKRVEAELHSRVS